MKATQQLHDLGQSLWLDNITRDLLNSGTLKRYEEGVKSFVKSWDDLMNVIAAKRAALKKAG